MDNGKDRSVVLFDGICHLCDGAVHFINKKEKSPEFHFAPLQSDTAKTLLTQYGYPDHFLDGLVLIEKNRAYDRSSACLRIAGRLKLPWSLFFCLLIIPKWIRDPVYQAIAKFRYRYFGRKSSCTLPQGVEESRFL
jgi:predicted DCC family thiol-disulfide oxidoreductase YuxK